MDDKKLKSYRKAGEIAKEVREWSKTLIKKDAKLLDIAEKTEAKIKSSGGNLAFPVNICINDVTAHYTPKYNDESVVGKDDVVSVDLGVHIDGYVADTAYTIDLSKKHAALLEANQLALEKAILLIKDGTSVREIGRTVQQTLAGKGFKPIENLTGHQVEQYELHAGISIPNIDVPYEWTLKEDMVLALEPFATNGAGRVVESKHAEIYSLLEKKPARVPEARIILQEIEDRGRLPFAERWFSKKVNPMKLNLALRDLVSREILKAYPTLHEKERGIVSQFEHTVIVTKTGCEMIT